VKRLVATVALFVLGTLPALADPATDAIRGAALKLATSSSYHVTIEAKGHEIEGDVVPPDKLHVTMGPMEAIEIAKTTYVKMGGSWHEFTLPGIDRVTAPLDNARSYAKAAPSDITVSDLGMKTVDGLTAHAYLVKGKEVGSTANTLYVDANGYLARIDSDTSDGTATILFTKYNAPLTIAAPI
jgi:hypothetical protein